MLKVSPWKGVVRFGRKGKLAPRYVGPFEILERIGPVAYRLRFPNELGGVHDTFHVSNLKKCLADANLHMPLNDIKIDKTLRFVEKPVEILDREIKSLKRSRIALVKVRWESKRGPEFTWEREDFMKTKYPELFVDRENDIDSDKENDYWKVNDLSLMCKILGADQLLVILCYRYQESGIGYCILSMTINGAGVSTMRLGKVARERLLGMSPPIRRKYKNSIAIATGCKRFKNTKRSNRKIRIPIALWPCKVEEEMTLEEVDGQMVGKVETKIIAKDGTITKVPGKFKSYETSDEETEEQPRRRDLYRFVDHPQIQQANPMNEFAPHQIPQPLGNMNGWLIESEEEAERDEVDSDLESTASSKPVWEKTNKDDRGYASYHCPWCSK
ncbi:hypothetical protein Tco_1294851 [Tanacetum coccineum]